MPRPRDQAHRAERLGAAERRVKAFELAKAGASYRAIGQALGVSHEQAHRDVVGELGKLNALSLQGAEDYRRLQLERLENLLRGIWLAATGGDVAAQAAALRILERQAKLLGLDAPQRIDMQLVHERARELAAEYGLDVTEVLSQAERITKGLG